MYKHRYEAAGGKAIGLHNRTEAPEALTLLDIHTSAAARKILEQWRQFLLAERALGIGQSGAPEKIAVAAASQNHQHGFRIGESSYGY